MLENMYLTQNETEIEEKINKKDIRQKTNYEVAG